MIGHRLNERPKTAAGSVVNELPQFYCDCGGWSTQETDEAARKKAHHLHVSTIGKTMSVIGSAP